MTDQTDQGESEIVISVSSEEDHVEEMMERWRRPLWSPTIPKLVNPADELAELIPQLEEYIKRTEASLANLKATIEKTVIYTKMLVSGRRKNPLHM